MNTKCLFFQVTPEDNKIDSSWYKDLTDCAINSFKSFHPEIETIFINDSNYFDYARSFKHYDVYEHLGLARYILAYELMDKQNIDKLILLGCDTITCGTLDEFLNSTEDVLATLNYPNYDSTPYWSTPQIEFITPDNRKCYEILNLNADVVCFNNKEALKKVIDLTIEHFTEFAEQGGLNELAFVDKSYEVNIVDGPYFSSPVSYNVRSKGVFGTDMIRQGKMYRQEVMNPQVLAMTNYPLIPSGEWTPIYYWKVKNDKLYTSDNKQIKVFHFAEGLGVQSKEEFFNKLNDFKTWFNKETIEFFNTKCNCKHFFNDNV